MALAQSGSSDCSVMRMDTLPRDLVAYIGKSLQVTERVNCLNAANCFGSICHEYKKHVVNFNEENYNNKLNVFSERFDRLYKHVKPKLDTLYLVFDDINTFARYHTSI